MLQPVLLLVGIYTSTHLYAVAAIAALTSDCLPASVYQLMADFLCDSRVFPPRLSTVRHHCSDPFCNTEEGDEGFVRALRHPCHSLLQPQGLGFCRGQYLGVLGFLAPSETKVVFEAEQCCTAPGFWG